MENYLRLDFLDSMLGPPFDSISTLVTDSRGKRLFKVNYLAGVGEVRGFEFDFHNLRALRASHAD